MTAARLPEVRRCLLALATALALTLGAPRTALAWLDLRIVSDVATVELPPDGPATVHHEMMLRVRGGPLQRFSIHGVDEDAVSLEGATLVLAKSGRAAGVPIALVAEREQDLLTLELAYTKGVRSGTYLVQFSYQTDLRARGLLTDDGSGQRLSWKSPRFDDGIGSLEARFVVGPGQSPPLLDIASEETTGGGATLVATPDGVYLAESRRDGDRQILELTRPHAARGEQVTWPVRLGGRDDGEAAIPGPLPTQPEPRRRKPVPSSELARTGTWFGGGLALGVGFALLVWQKRRWLLAQRGRATPASAFLLPLPLGLRFVLVASSVAFAVGLAMGLERAMSGGLALLLAMLLSVQHALPEKPTPRGPGSWEPIEPDAAFAPRRTLSGAGKLLEGTTAPGLVVFSLLEATTLIFALRALGQAPAHSAALLALAALWVPLFFTLGGARLAATRGALEAAVLAPHHALLVKRRLPVTLIGRVPSKGDGEGTLDELRLRFDHPDPVAGFDSLELALEWHHGGWSLSVRPVFIARVREGSLAHDALPRHAQWSRGRDRDERVALIRPFTAWPSGSAAVAKELLARLTRPKTSAAVKTARERGRSRGANPGAPHQVA